MKTVLEKNVEFWFACHNPNTADNFTNFTFHSEGTFRMFLATNQNFSYI